MSDRNGMRTKPGPSNAYLRLLAGKLTSARYVAILKRGVDMSLRRSGVIR